MELIELRYLKTTYDGITDTFGHATTLIGPFFSDDDFDKALKALNELRKKHGLLEE